MRTTTKIAAALSALALAGSTLGAQAVAGDHGGDHGSSHGKGHEHGHHYRHGPRIDHLYVIMLENHSQSSVIGDENAPFLNRVADAHVMADHYFGVTHPSMPNYIASIAGDNFGIQDDNDQNVVNLDRRNLVDQLEAHHIRWDAYMEDLPGDKLARFGPTIDGTTHELYAKKHNPFVLFDSVKNDPGRMAHVKDYSALAGDLHGRETPQFVWISPNQCHDMHGGVDTVPGHAETPCGFGDTTDPTDENDQQLKQKADDFVKQAVRTIRGSDAWTDKSAIVIVTDENDYTGTEETGGWESADGCCDSPYVPKGDTRISPEWPGGTYGGGLVPAIIVTERGPHGFVDHTPYNHYSLLTTVEQNWRLGYLGHAGDTAGGVVPMWDSFRPRR